MLPRALRGVAAWMLAALIVAPAALADPSDLDTTFDTAGVTQLTPADTWAEDLVPQSDGKLIVPGTVDNGDGTFDSAIARVNADGGVDTGWQSGNGGVKAFSEGGQNIGATAAAIESDGTVDVVGDARFGPPNAAVRVLRFTNIGTSAGTAQAAITGATEVTGNGIAVQPDGKLVVAGTAHFGVGVDRIFVARFNADGTADTTFDNDGTADGVLVVADATCDSADTRCQGDSLALAPDGDIYVGGESQGAEPGARIARFVAGAGGGFALDGAYGSAGVLKIAAGTLADANSLLAQPDGKVVALGSTSDQRCAATRRLAADGAPDLGFGASGAAAFDLGGDFCVIGDAALLGDGRIAFAGGNVTGTNETQAVGRLTAAGQPDTTFANGGIAARPIGSLSFAGGIVALADGRLLTAGGTGLPHHMLSTA